MSDERSQPDEPTPGDDADRPDGLPDEVVETDDAIEEIRDGKGGTSEDGEHGDGEQADREQDDRSVTEHEPRAEGEFAADGEFEAADAEPLPGVEPDEAGDALVSRLRLIEDQELSERADALGQVHDELRSRLESGDGGDRPA